MLTLKIKLRMAEGIDGLGWQPVSASSSLRTSRKEHVKNPHLSQRLAQLQAAQLQGRRQLRGHG
ncbi:hypothetical protein [Comamonas sp. JC664]|uniref:hypothetical protein n=1 Tax=Comamonas sp. JC664 TaxID=2801917 RepID=UPI0036173946